MKKIIQVKREYLHHIEKALKAYSSYLHLYGNEEEMIIEFSSNENEESIDATLEALTEEALEARLASDKKIQSLLEKEDKKAKAAKYKEVKKDPSLTAEEIAICDEIIAELEA